MSDFPQTQVLPLHLSSVSALYSGAADGNSAASSAGFATYNWPAQNQACYIPMTVPWHYPIFRVFWCNGSSAGGNNDFGIYSEGGSRIYHTGATAQSGVNQLQYVSPTAFVLPPGNYYFALSYDNATLTNRSFGFSALAAPEGKLSGLFQQASAAPLPESATFATWAATGVPLIGVTRTASGF